MPGTSRKTGRPLSSDWVMVFTIKNGKVVKFREFIDAEAVNPAFLGA